MYRGLHQCMRDECRFFRRAVSWKSLKVFRYLLKCIRRIPAQSLQSLVSALLEQLPEKTSPVVITVKPERPTPNPGRTNGYRTANQGPVYDPAIVFVLELATVLAMRDAESIATVGQAVADALYTVVRDAATVHPLLLSRAVYYLLHLLNTSQVSLEWVKP